MNLTIEDLYERKRREKRAMSHHMPALARLAAECKVAVEFGIRTGPSTVALLHGLPPDGVLHSFDVQRLDAPHQEIERAAGKRWVVKYMASQDAPVQECDLLMHDSFHNYSQVDMELQRHAHAVRKYLVFHDSISCAVKGEGITGGTKYPHLLDTRGIRLAIDELMIRDSSWTIYSHDPDSAGLLVLRRKS
jgi:hypothetical protein